jgi:hypothetical protein
MADGTTSLGELRQQNQKVNNPFSSWFHRHCPFLFNIHSLFYFFWLTFGLGLLWMVYSLATNSGTQLLGWDYSYQYIPFGYQTWDCWHHFFDTGEFQLYSENTFLGSDNIGSNSYYGLFDPFVFFVVFFPRAWVPQLFAVAAMLKGAVGALTMRAYIKYLGGKEESARLGGFAFAYCGYLNFMVGFPSTVSMCCTIPLILLGIEKVIKEKKPLTLALGLALLGLISFFFLVVMCIFGVLYALWRYFATIKKRNWKDNLIVIGLGVGGFAIGLALCSWTLFPSLRESSLSGRTTSIGMAYLRQLTTAFKDQDFKTIFARLFEMVGDNQGRELMPLVSFFYPTCNYLWLPVYKVTAGYSYDAWTASLFCYTPMIILFFYALVGWIRRKEWGKLVAFALCCWLLFTTFAYYFFYAFTGDGYGRWFIVLVPIIIASGALEFGKIKTNPQWQLLTATFLAAFLTIFTYIITQVALSGATILNSNNLTYWKTTYIVPAVTGGTDGKVHSLLWIVLYQMGLVVVESLVIFYLRDKKYLYRILMGFVAVETIVSGNLTYVYGSSFSYSKRFGGGDSYRYAATEAFSELKSYDGSSYYRCYSDSDAIGSDNEDTFGYNGAWTFHSLYNYGVADLAHMSHFIPNDGAAAQSYGQWCSRHNWSGYYDNKRYGFDTAAGYKYYAIYNDENYQAGDYVAWDDDSYRYNVPFDSECVVKTDKWRIYQNPYALSLGHAVDDVYYMNKADTQEDDTPNLSDFYSASTGFNGYREIIRNEDVYLKGAILDDGATLPEGVSVKEAPDKYDYNADLTYLGGYNSIYAQIYTTKAGVGYNVADPGAFLTDSSLLVESTAENPNPSNVYTINNPASPHGLESATYTCDDQKVVIKCYDNGGYFNTDPSGAYFLMNYNAPASTRVYMIGDLCDREGHVLKENALLNYEWMMLNNSLNGTDDNGGLSYSGLYGFYAPGKVKAIVFCARGSGSISFSSSFYLWKEERSVIEEQHEKLASSDDYALHDVVHTTDKFTYSTNFPTDRFVVTSLAYDEGWSVKCQDAEGTVSYPTMYRLDGGFVGYYSPAGEQQCTLTFETKYLKEGVTLAVSGGLLLGLYEILRFLKAAKNNKNDPSTGGTALPVTDGQPQASTSLTTEKENTPGSSKPS